MDSIASKEVSYTIQDLQAAIATITQITDGIEKDCSGIESSRCVKYLRFLADNYSSALRAIRSLA